MDKKSETFGLKSEELARLMKIGSDTGERSKDLATDEVKSELLRDRLGEALPPDPTITEMLPIIPEDMAQTMGLTGGEPIESILQNPRSDISAVIRVKDYYNLLSERSESKVYRDTAIAIYYAAIASSLIFHDRKITGFSYDRLERSFSSLIGKPWMSPRLITLFEKARNVCQNPSAIRQHEEKTLPDISEDTTI